MVALGRAIVLLGNELSVPAKYCCRGKEYGGFFEKLTGELPGLGGQPSSLSVIQQNSFVLLLLFQQDHDLLFEIINGIVKFSINAIRQASNQCNPKSLSHSPQMVSEPPISYKYFHRKFRCFAVVQ